MKIMHVILSTAVIGVVVAVFGFITYSDVPEPANARFIDVSILGEGEMINDIPVIRLGHFATITLGVEKLSAAPINDVVIRSYLSNSNNGDFLLIDNSYMHADLKMEHEEYLEYSKGIKTDPFQGTDKTPTMMINVVAIESPPSQMDETINVVLYADGVEMDRMSFDVIVKNTGI